MTQLIEHERIETTHPRAKELSKFADRCVTLAKDVRSRLSWLYCARYSQQKAQAIRDTPARERVCGVLSGGDAVQGGLPARRRLQGIVHTEREEHKLCTLLAQRYREREGGYTRVVRTRRRLGDAAELSVIEFVDRPGELREPRPPQSSRGLGGAGAARGQRRGSAAEAAAALLPAAAQPLVEGP